MSTDSLRGRDRGGNQVSGHRARTLPTLPVVAIRLHTGTHRETMSDERQCRTSVSFFRAFALTKRNPIEVTGP
jgi:hypothetical protein